VIEAFYLTQRERLCKLVVRKKRWEMTPKQSLGLWSVDRLAGNSGRPLSSQERPVISIPDRGDSGVTSRHD
jgi:hypothetical protein